MESAESIQYKKTMLHRYLNDAIEVSNATACSRESEVLVTNKPESSKGLIISEENCGVVQVNLFQKLFFLQNMGENMSRTEIVSDIQNNFCTQQSSSPQV